MIKSKFRMFIGVALSVLALTGAKEGAAQAPALLDCRGGAPMSALYEPTGSGSQLRIFFDRAPLGTGVGALAPGQCAWRDRALRAGEPAALMLSSGERVSRLALTKGSISVEPVPSSLTKLMSSVFTGSPFTVLIGQNAGSSLVIYQVY